MATHDVVQTGPVAFSAGVHAEDGVTTIALVGEVDVSTAGALREVLAQPDVIEAPLVLLDLTKVSFLGSPGIGVLVSACKRVNATGGAFSLICDRNCQRVLEVSGLVDYLHVEVTE